MHEVPDQQAVRRELDNAVSARQAGNEGRARVCARRAAGWAIAIYRRTIGEASEDDNALHNLTWLLENEPDPAIRQAAERLLARVGKDFRLPHPQDPLEDARRIIAKLLE